MEEPNRILYRFGIVSYVVSIILLVFFLWGAVSWAYDSQFHYVKGKYGKICYVKGIESKNIQYPVYFKTLSECVAALR